MLEVRVVTTEKALHFFSRDSLPVEVFSDEDEWKAWSKRGDPVLHIELRRWADVMVIAPLDANTMAKISHGICDNLLLEVRVVTTEKALHFFSRDSLPVEVFTDEDEWRAWSKRGDPVLHIELRRWADVMVIAPLDANTMAKITHGICDNLLTCIVRAWDLQRPLLFAPAMNTYMWDHPLTAQQRAALKGFGYTEIPVVEKTLICGDTGSGAMAEVPTIVEAVVRACDRGTDRGCDT